MRPWRRVNGRPRRTLDPGVSTRQRPAATKTQGPSGLRPRAGQALAPHPAGRGPRGRGRGLFTCLSPKVYTAQTQSFVALPHTGHGSSDILSGANLAQRRVNSYTQIVGSPGVLQPVIDTLHLDATVRALAGRVSAPSPLHTVLINVQAKDAEAQQAADIANATAKQLGLALGLAHAFLRESLDTQVKSIEDVTGLLGAASLGAIPFDANAKTKPLVALDQRASRSELFRSIRTNQQFVDVDKPPQVVVITSAVTGEGKTTSACNLGIAMAQSGQKVVLVDCDMRRPRVANYLEISGSTGLTNVPACSAPSSASCRRAASPSRGGSTVMAPADTALRPGGGRARSTSPSRRRPRSDWSPSA